LKKSYEFVVKYLPDEYKDQAMATLGRASAQAAVARRATNMAECEFCGIRTTDAKEWEEHKLCPSHYAQALSDPAKFKRFFGFQQQSPLIGEHVASKSLESWEDRKARMSPEHSEMETTIQTLLLDKGIRPVLTNQKYCLLSTVPDFVFPAQNLAVYLDGKAVHNGRQDRDDELRDLLRKRHGMRVLSITYGSKSKGEVDRIFNEIVREVKKE
jgi:very-short-patch-repair endonuclease